MAKLFPYIVLFLLLLSGVAWSHEEPPKSSADLADQDRIRLRFSAAKIKSEIWHETRYSADGKVAANYVSVRNQYDRDGRQVRAMVYDSLGSVAGNLEHVYDLEHQMLDQVECDQDSGCVRTIFVYRPDHLMALAVDFVADGSPIARLEYSYPAGDTVVHLIKRDSTRKITYTLDYYFHPNRIVGYVVRAVKLSPTGKVILSTEQTSDARGLVEKRVIGPDGKATVLYQYTRRDDGQLQKMTRTRAEGKDKQESVWEFGPHDLPVRETTTDATGRRLSTTEYEYEYF
jgi:hypothetical protein